MKSFVCTLFVVMLAVQAFAVPVAEESMDGEKSALEPAAHHEEDDSESVRFRKAAYAPEGKAGYAPEGKSAYAAPSYSAPAAYAPVTYSYPSPMPTVPCGKNIVLSCQPSVAPVPCSAPKYSAPAYAAPSYAGAYSEPIPQYAAYY